MDKVKLENASSFSARRVGIRWDDEAGHFTIESALFDSIR